MGPVKPNLDVMYFVLGYNFSDNAFRIAYAKRFVKGKQSAIYFETSYQGTLNIEQSAKQLGKELARASFGFDGVYKVHVGRDIYLHFKLGYRYLTSSSAIGSGSSTVLGLGFGHELADTISIRAMYERYNHLFDKWYGNEVNISDKYFVELTKSF